MDNTQVEKWLLAYISGRITPQETALLEEWAAASEENRQILDLIEGRSELGTELRRMYGYDKEKAWMAVCAADRHYTRRRRLVRAFRFAAAAVLFAGVLATGILLHDAKERFDPGRNQLSSTVGPGARGAVLELSSGRQVILSDSVSEELTDCDTKIEIRGNELAYAAEQDFPEAGRAVPEEPVYNTVRVPIGCEYSLTLSDGTRVWLNAGSSLTYPPRFEKGKREVSMTGEVYFDVARDPGRPFTVLAGEVGLTVLGTSFNVMAYADEPRVETTLVEGSVRVAAAGRETVLEPGFQAGFDRGGGSLTVRKVDADSFSAWTRGLLVFYDEPLRSICRKLERWYGVRIDASSPSLDGVLYTGMIKRYETLNEVADLMNLTNEVVFSEEDGVVRVELRSRNK